jgi:hypothetical protein
MKYLKFVNDVSDHKKREAKLYIVNHAQLMFTSELDCYKEKWRTHINRLHKDDLKTGSLFWNKGI